MRLFIPLHTPPIKVISSCSHNTRVAPLPDMKRCGNIMATYFRMRIKIPIRFYKLFCPIDCHSNTKCKQYAAKNWVSENEGMNGGKKTNQREKVPPNKLQCLLCSVPDELYRIHRLFPLNCYQDSTNCIKTPLQIISINNVMYIQAFPVNNFLSMRTNP